jgi:2-polyprenyl-3-methyl-5-hydroxy-6-metoxy-1,4-benzoquinol methylase
MKTAYCDVTDLSTFPGTDGGYDTVICLNVIEHVVDDRTALGNIKSVLAVGGRAIILVPQGPANMGTLDEVLGPRRRYTRGTLDALASDCGFKVLSVIRVQSHWQRGVVSKRQGSAPT